MATRGLNVSVDYEDDIYFVRSCTNGSGVLDITNLLGDIFSGRREWFEVIDHPTVLIVPGVANVALPSQLFPPKYTDLFDKAKLSDALDNDGQKINWTGVPSIIIDYKRSRTNLSESLGVSCLDFFFNMSSFNTSKCIPDFGKSHPKYRTKCQKFSELRRTCFDDKYNKHKTMYSINHKPVQFITKINDAVTAVVEEQTELDKKRGDNSVQMYNETFSYVYPWDVTGIEVGHKEFKLDTIELYNKLKQLRKEYAEIYTKFLNSLNKSFQIEIRDAVENLYKVDIKSSLTSCKYLLAKFIAECNCDAGNTVKYTIINMKTIIQKIIHRLEQPVVLWEYGRTKGDDKFNLFEVVITERDETPSFERSTTFELFYQTTSDDITVLAPYPPPSDQVSKSGDVASDRTMSKSPNGVATMSKSPNGFATTTKASDPKYESGGTKKRKTSRYRRGNRSYSVRRKTMRRTTRSSVRSRYN